MKKKKFALKLSLRKETIANLQKKTMNSIRAGMRKSVGTGCILCE